MKQDIEQKIDSTLNATEGMSRALPTPFFYTRLEAALLPKNNIWEKISQFVARPAVAIATVAIIVSMNIWAINQGSDAPVATNKEVANVDEYRQLNTDLIEFENLNP